MHLITEAGHRLAWSIHDLLTAELTINGKGMKYRIRIDAAPEPAVISYDVQYGIAEARIFGDPVRAAAYCPNSDLCYFQATSSSTISRHLLGMCVYTSSLNEVLADTHPDLAGKLDYRSLTSVAEKLMREAVQILDLMGMRLSQSWPLPGRSETAR